MSRSGLPTTREVQDRRRLPLPPRVEGAPRLAPPSGTCARGVHAPNPTRRATVPLWSHGRCPSGFRSPACRVFQGALVALPVRAATGRRCARLRGGRLGGRARRSRSSRFVAIARAAESASAQGLTYLALFAVPPLAALALGWLSRGARPAPRAARRRAVRARLGRPRRARRQRRRDACSRALSCVALGVAARRGHAGALARRGDRRDGDRGHGARRLRPAAAARTTRSTPRIRRPGCRGCRAPRSARR